MRKRKWVLVLAIIGAIFVFGGYIGWRVTRADDRIKEILLARARPFLSQESDIEKVEMDLSNLHLRGVRLAPKDRSFSLEIEDVRLGYRFWNLLKYRLAPHKVAHDVVLVHPVVVIQKSSLSEESRSGEEGWLDFQGVVEELETVRRITVAEAEVILEDSSGQRVRLAHSMNGWLRDIPSDSAIVRLSGKLFESKSDNLAMEGKLNLLSGRPVRMRIQIKESEPTSELPFLLPSYIEVTAGKIQGEMTFEHKKESSGLLEIQDGTFSFRKANLTFENVNVKGNLEGKDIILRGTVQKFNGSPLTISGRIRNILDPRLNLTVRCSRFDIPTFLGDALPGARFSFAGRAQFGIHYTGSLNNPTMRGDFVSQDLRAYGIAFNRFSAKIGLRDNVFTLIGNGVQEGGLELDLKGKVDFSDSLQATSLTMDSRGNILPFFPSWSRKQVVACTGELGIRLVGGLRNLRGEGRGVLAVVSGEGDTLRVWPNLRYEDQKLTLDVQSNGRFRSEGEVLSPFQKDFSWNIQAQGMTNLVWPLFDGKIRRTLDKLTVDGNFVGSHRGWGVWIEGLSAEGRSLPRIFEVGITSGGEQKKQGQVELQAVYYGSGGGELPLLMEGVVSENGVLVERCEVGDFVSFAGRYPFHSDGNMQGNIKLSNFYLEKLHDIFPQTRSYLGEIRGGIRMTGTRSRPKIHFGLTLRDGLFHSVGVFDGDLDYQWEGRKLRFCSLSLRRDGIPLLEGEAECVEGDSLEGRFWGEKINFGDLITAFTGKSVISGEGDTEIKIGGATRIPIISGKVELRDGSVGPVSFRDLRTELVDTLSKGADFGRGGLIVRNGILDRDDGLNVHFWGDFPHGEGKDVDFSVLARGNILGLLPELSGLFEKAEGSGEVVLRWVGRPGEWELGDGWMQINGGSVEMTSFVKRIEKLRGEARLQRDERFIHVSNLKGEVDGGEFIFSTRQGGGGANGLTPLVFNKLGIQLGILQLETNGKGVRLHLPGLMEGGDEGWVAFGGLEPEKSFIIGGSASFPLLRGTIYLTDHRITYPFLHVQGESGSDRTLAFLKRVHWDLLVVPRKDVRYVRNIESPLGNLYANLQLRDGYGGLRMQGIIQEGTFQVWGNLISTEGTLDALDRYFRPERITFDYPKGTKDPIISGRAFTTVIDSMGMSSTVWLSLTSVDDATGVEREGGRWGKIKFQFSTDNPNLGRTEADLLAALGYSEANFKDRAYDALGMQVENLVFRPIFRPLERGMRRHLGLDVVRLSSMFSRNIVQLQTKDRLSFDPKFLLRSTRLTLGKYLAPGLIVLYSGQIQKGLGLQYPTHGIGFRHAITLEYTIRPDLFLEMEYTYDSQLLSDRRQDKRIWLRHIFPF